MMERAFKAINEMVKKGILKNYAIGGAVATLYYTEPFPTKDVDVFFSPDEKEKIILLTPFYDFLLKTKNYETDGEYIIIGDTPIQFIPATSDLEKEAVENAIEVDYKNTVVRIFTPEYLIAIALKVFRDRDREKIFKLMKYGNIDKELLNEILMKHNLKEKFDRFLERYYG